MRALGLSPAFLVAFLIVFTLTSPASPQTAVPMLLNHRGESRSPTTGEPVDGWNPQGDGHRSRRDADKEGFLRTRISSVQTIGPAARNLDGKVVLYSDRFTDSIRPSVDETNRRREVQKKYSCQHVIIPESLKRQIADILASLDEADCVTVPFVAEEIIKCSSPDELRGTIWQLREETVRAAKELCFEDAARLSDRIKELEEVEVTCPRSRCSHEPEIRRSKK